MANIYSYPHVEDYIEIIAGSKTPAGKISYSIFQLPESPVSLARYDVKVVESFAEQARNGIGFTDRQAKLATDLVVKYERQLFKLGVDITPVKTNAVFRMPIRVIDRSTCVWVEDDRINIRFPFQAEIINIIKEEARVSKGAIRWSPDKKIWSADLTEYTVNWVYAFSRTHNFEIEPSLQHLMDQILIAEQTPIKIELQARDTLYIANAHNTLVEYVDTTLGGFELNNLLTLVDSAPLLGYTVEKIIEETVIEAYGTRFWSLCANRELKVDSMTNHTLVKDIADYARATDRFPIYVYEPDLSDRLKTEFNKYFAGTMITMTSNLVSIPEDIQVVYTTKIPRTPIERIPLLVSSAGMLFGGDRQIWIQTAEKVVYFTNDVYNKNKEKGRDICKLS
jgi:hypothetical protein